MAKVSILLPVYNGARFLRPALDSLLRQTFTDFELIAVNDGSTDSSRILLDEYVHIDPRVRVISRSNTGIVGALNDALAAATAPLVARMDADDIALPERLAQQVAFMAEHPDVLGCGTAVYFIDNSGSIVDRVARPLDFATIEAALLRGDGGALIHPTTMFRTTAMRQIGGYRLKAQFTEDLDLYLRLAELGPLANLAEPLLHYRVHFASTNFKRASSKAAVKREVLREAHLRRGRTFNEANLELSYFLKSAAQFHREWAESASRVAKRRTAVKHALLAVVKEPTRRSSYSMLRLVLSRVLKPARKAASGLVTAVGQADSTPSRSPLAPASGNRDLS